MYEHFKNELVVAIADKVDSEEIRIITRALDDIAINYEFSEKRTDLIVYGSDIPQLLKTYLVCKKIEGLSEQTLYNYQTCLFNFFRSTGKKPDEITSNDIRVYLYMYQERHGVTNRSLDKIRQNIAGFYRWAQDEEYILKNPARKIPKIKYEEKPRKALTQIELEYVRKACATTRERAIIETLYSTGCRVSELAILKITDIDFNTKKVHLFGKGSKHRDSFINAKAEVAIKEYLKERDSDCVYLFVSDRKPHNQLQKAAIEKIIRQISERCECDKKFTPHTFRHTTATTAIKNGMPVESIQKMLGHSKIDTTMIYAHADLEKVQSQHLRSVI